jgi:hypothetical protein
MLRTPTCNHGYEVKSYYNLLQSKSLVCSHGRAFGRLRLHHTMLSSLGQQLQEKPLRWIILGGGVLLLLIDVAFAKKKTRRP